MQDEAPPTAVSETVDTKWTGADKLREHLVPIPSLRPFPENPEKSQKHVDELASSLRRFGQVRAVLVRDDATIVAGHHVVKAARQLGWTHIAAIPAEFASHGESRDYLLADNFLGRGGVDSKFNKDQLSWARSVDSFEGLGITREQLEDELAVQALKTEQVRIDSLQEHADNYKEHPPEQIAHIAESLKQHGIYRNVVVANDGTILAGHGIVKAAQAIGLKHVPVQRLDVASDHPDAIKVMAGDNEIGRLAEMDDRALTKALKKVVDEGDISQLLGTGYDAQTLANLVFVSRPASEIQNHDAAREWIGLPEFEKGDERLKTVVSHDTEEDRDEFVALLDAFARRDGEAVTEKLEALPEDVDGVTIVQKRPSDGDGASRTVSFWWPPRPKQDLASVRFESKEDR